MPNNATLVVAGDFRTDEAKRYISEYFGSIPKGADIARNYPKEDPITESKEVNWGDPNIQLPAYLFSYRVPGQSERDSYVLSMISNYLSGGKSSVLYKKLVDDEKKALQVQAVNLGLENYGVFAFFAIPMGSTSKDVLQKDIDAEVKKLQTTLISDEDFQKLQNVAENNFVNSNSSVEGIASSLATYHVLYGNANLINKEIDIYRSITKEEIRDVAKKYLNPNQRVIINYVPEKK